VSECASGYRQRRPRGRGADTTYVADSVRRRRHRNRFQSAYDVSGRYREEGSFAFSGTIESIVVDRENTVSASSALEAIAMAIQ